MTEKMDRTLKTLAARAGSNPFLKTISEAFNLLMPMVTVGAVFTLLNNLNIQGYQNFIIDTGLKPLLALPSRFTIDLVSLYLAFASGCSFLNVKGKAAESIPAGLVSAVCFFIMTFSGSGAADSLGFQGLFTALVSGIFTGFIWDWLTDRGQRREMGGASSPVGTKFFRGLAPGFAAVALCLAVSGCFLRATGLSLNQWLYGVLREPLGVLSGNLFIYCALMFLSDVFWFFGIHGAQITNPFFIILFMTGGIRNQAALAAGQPVENILTTGLLAYLTLGGAGSTAGLAVDMLLFSRSRRYKTLGRMAVLPTLCNINEPILFGVPMILNPLMALPFFVLPQVTIIFTYLAMSAGMVGLPRLAMGTSGTPLFLDGFLMCGISGVVWQVMLVGITSAGYYPFFRILDKAACAEEQGDGE